MIAAVLLLLLAGRESIRREIMWMPVYAAESEADMIESAMPAAREETMKKEKAGTENYAGTAGGEKVADVQNDRTEILTEGTATKTEQSEVQKPASDTCGDEAVPTDPETGLTITSIETETDTRPEETADAGLSAAVLNGTVSAVASEEAADQKQTATMTDGETDADQMESEPSTDAAEPVTEAPSGRPVHLGIDNRHRYEGMEQSFADGYQPEIRDGNLYLTVPFTASGALQGDCLTVDLVFAEKENAPFVFKNYQKEVKRRTYFLQNGIMIPQGADATEMAGNDPATSEAAERVTPPGDTTVTTDQQDAYCYTCEVPLQENATPGQYSVTVKAWGYTADGEKAELDCQIFIRIPEPEPTTDPKGSASGGSTGGGYTGDGGGGSETAEEVLHQPKLLLETCSLSGAPLTAGAEEPMHVQFRNRSQTQTIYNLKVTASADSKAVQPLRNSWYFTSVAPGEAIEIEDGVKVATATEDTGAVLSFDFEYEDKKGTAASGKENVPLSIDQPTSVELRTASVPAVLYATDTQEFPVQVLNLSRVPVYNVRVQLSGTGLFPTEDVFIGNMDAGTEGNGTMKIYVGTRTMQAIGSDSGTEDSEKYGLVSGTITLQYEDASGETHTQTESFQSEIKKPEILSLKVEDTPQTNAWWISVFAAVGAGMLLAIVVLALRLRKKSALLHDMR